MRISWNNIKIGTLWLFENDFSKDQCYWSLHEKSGVKEAVHVLLALWGFSVKLQITIIAVEAPLFVACQVQYLFSLLSNCLFTFSHVLTMKSGRFDVQSVMTVFPTLFDTRYSYKCLVFWPSLSSHMHQLLLQWIETFCWFTGAYVSFSC